VRYHVYRGLLSSLGYDDWGQWANTTSGTDHFDSEEPLAGAGFFYLVSGDDDIREGTKGYATCAERSNYSPAP
jgi:hypothetical protein